MGAFSKNEGGIQVWMNEIIFMIINIVFLIGEESSMGKCMQEC